jgi:branched-chain amino acid transport system ATP-binding protein
MTDPILEVKNVTKKFGELVAVDNVSFDVAKGEAAAIIGPNGAGKTTLLNVISGLLRAEAGHLLFRRADITPLKAHERAKLGIARTFQVPIYLRGVTVIENITAGVLSRERNYEKARRKAQEMLGVFGIKDFGKKGEDLTLMEEKKLEIARALAQDPSILLLDGPHAI